MSEVPLYWQSGGCRLCDTPLPSEEATPSKISRTSYNRGQDLALTVLCVPYSRSPRFPWGVCRPSQRAAASAPPPRSLPHTVEHVTIWLWGVNIWPWRVNIWPWGVNVWPWGLVMWPWGVNIWPWAVCRPWRRAAASAPPPRSLPPRHDDWSRERASEKNSNGFGYNSKCIHTPQMYEYH